MQAFAKTLRFKWQKGKVRILSLSNNLKKIFLHDYHKENKAKFASFAGYDMPINYELGIINYNMWATYKSQT